MAEETVWTFIATDEVSPVLDEIEASVSGLGESVGGVASAIAEASSTMAESMSAAGEAMAGIGESASSATEGFSGLGGASAEAASSLSETGSSASGTDDILRGLAAIIETLQEGFSTLDGSLSEVAANTADTAASVDEMASALQNMAGAADEAATAASGVGAASSEAGGGLGGFLGSIGDAASSFGMFVIGAQATVNIAGQIGGALFGADAAMEQTQVAFTTLTGSASAAHDMISKLVTFAASTPFHEAGIENAAEKMLAFHFTNQQVIPDLTAIGDTLSALGKSSDANLSSIVDIFGKIQAAGKLTGGDMTQLTRWGIPAWNLLAQSMGTTVPALQEMVKKGLVPANVAVDGLTKGMEKTFGGGMKAQSQTFNGLMSTLADNITTAWRAFSGPLFDAAKGSLIQLGNLVSSKGFQQWAADMGKAVGTGITAVVHFIQNDLMPAFAAIGKWFDEHKSTFAAIGKAIGDLFAAGKGAGANMFGELMKDLPTVWGFLQQVGNFLRDTFEPVWDTLVTVFKTQVAPAFQQVMDALGPAMPALKFIGEVIGGILLLALIGLAEMLAMLAKGAIEAFGLIVGAISFFVSMMLKGLTAAYNFVMGVIGFFSNLGPNISKIWNAIVTWLTGIWDGLSHTATIYWEYLYAAIRGKILQAEATVHTLWTNITNWLSTTWNNLVHTAEQWGTNIINNILNGLKAAWSNVTTWFQNALAWIAGLFPHSPVEHGPLSGIENWGGHITDVLATGIRAGMPNVQAAFTQGISSTVAGLSTNVSLSSTSLGTGVGGGLTAQHAQQIITLLQDIKQQGQGAGGVGSVTQNIGPNHFAGVTNPQQLYNLLNQLAGASYEGGLRGNSAGLSL